MIGKLCEVFLAWARRLAVVSLFAVVLVPAAVTLAQTDLTAQVPEPLAQTAPPQAEQTPGYPLPEGMPGQPAPDQGMPGAPTPTPLGQRLSEGPTGVTGPTLPTPTPEIVIGPTPLPTTAPDWKAGPDASAAVSCPCRGAIDYPTTDTFPTQDKPFKVAGWFVDTTAQGWAGFDAVHVYQGRIGEGGRLLAMANILGSPRPDVAQALGSPFWTASGWEATVPAGALQPGNVSLTVYVHSPSKGWWWKQVDFTINRPRLSQPILQVLEPRQGEKIKNGIIFTVNGYALDPGAFDTTGVDRVDVYIDGARGEPQAQFLGMADVVDPSAEALATYGARFANTGWSLQFDPSKFKLGNRTLYVYARSTATAAETLVTVDLNIVTS